MADEQPVTTEDMLDYLNLDETPENKTVVDVTLKASQSWIQSAVNKNLSASTLNADDDYITAIKALAGAMFYDRTLANGVPLGVKMLITILQGRYDKWPNNQNIKDLDTKPTNSQM